jgi:hypothetical protein
MNNLGTAKLTTFRLKHKLAYGIAIKTFGGYIFHRVSKDKKYYIQADKGQQKILRQIGITLIPVEDD